MLLIAMKTYLRYVITFKTFLRYFADNKVLQVHAGIAEVAAAKARMFVNKPDGSMSFLELNTAFKGE